MKRMLMMATTAAMIEQFNKNNILILEEMGYEVHVAGNFKEGNPISEERLEQFKEWLTQHNGKWFHIPSTRKPTDINNVKAYKQIINLIKEYKYEFIHCHTPIGSVIARCAAHKTNTPIIYTAHGFHFFKGAPLKNWLIYYPVEKFLSRWTDVLILINNEDYNRAGKFHTRWIEKIPGVGVDTKHYRECNIDPIQKRESLGIDKDKFILLSVGELQKRKNQEVVIKALGKLKNKNIIYLIVGKGELKNEYEQMIQQLGLKDNVRLLGYRTDVEELCYIADCFVHPSIREGLGIAPLEAMASGCPLISADINGMKDYTENGKTGYCIDPKSIKETENAINRMYMDETFRKTTGQYNLKVAEKYDVHRSNEKMKQIYKIFIQNKGNKND